MQNNTGTFEQEQLEPTEDGGAPVCAYDTTVDKLHEPRSSDESIPLCLRRNRLDTPYFPAIERPRLIAIIALCAIFLLTSLNRLNHTDLWGHLSYGRWIVENGALPVADPFAAEPVTGYEGKPFFNLPWLAQIAGYFTVAGLGAEGLILLHALIVTAACGVLMWAAYCRNVHPYWAVAAGIFAFVLSLPVIGTIRPQLFGMLGTACVLWGCAVIANKKHPLIWLPITFAIWANVHGSFAIGLLILGICSLGISWTVRNETNGFARTFADLRFRRVWTCLALCTAACCLNPLGPVLLFKVASFGNHQALANISEWRAMTPASFTGALFLSSLVILAVALKASARKLDFKDIALLLVFGAATVSAIRMVTWWAFVWAWVAAPVLASAWQVWMKRKVGEDSEPAEKSPMFTVLAMGFVFMTLLMAPPSQSIISGNHRGIGDVTTTDTPLYVAKEFFVARQIKDRFFAPMDLADYISWKSEGEAKPLVYTHVHLLNPDTWKDYQIVAAGAGNWYDVVKKHDLKYVVASRQRNPNLAKELYLASRSSVGKTRITYQDRQCVVAEVLESNSVDQSTLGSVSASVAKEKSS